MKTGIGFASVGVLLLCLGQAKAEGGEIGACMDGTSRPGAVASACGRVLARKNQSAAIRAAAHVCRGKALTAVGEGDGGEADYIQALELAKADGGLVPAATCVPDGDVALAVCGLDDFKTFDFVKDACGQVVSRGDAGKPSSIAAALRIRSAVVQEAGYPGDTLVDLELAARLAPEDADIRFQRGRALYAKGSMARAAADFRIAVAARPEDPERQLRLLHALLVVGDLAGSLPVSDRLVALRPDANSFLERARIRSIRGEVEEAIADLRIVRTIDREYASMPVYPRAVLDRAVGHLDYLLKQKLGAETKPLHRLRGEALARRGELARALTDFEIALGAKPDDVIALAGRADIRMRRLDFAGGLADFRSVLAVDPAVASAQGEGAVAAQMAAREIVGEFGTLQSAAVGTPKAMH